MKIFFSYRITEILSIIEVILSCVLALLVILLIISFLTSFVCLVITMVSPVKTMAVENIGIASSDLTIPLFIAIFIIFMMVYHEKK